MSNLKTYTDWEVIISQETGHQVVDPDGYRMILREKRENDLMTREEAERYFAHNTIMFNRKISNLIKITDDSFNGVSSRDYVLFDENIRDDWSDIVRFMSKEEI